MNKLAVRYIVDDVEAAIEFYTDLLDFEVLMHPAPGFALLKKGPLEIYLNQPGAGGAGKKLTGGGYPKPGGWNRIQLPVENLELTYNHLREKGAVFRNEIVEGKGGKQVLLEDPSGNPIELFEFNGMRASQEKSTFKPEGYRTVTPYLAIRNAEELVHFLKRVLNAEEHRLMRWEDGSFMHGEFRIGDSLVMIGDVKDQHDPFPGMLYVYVPNVDQTYQKALKEGGSSIEEPADQDYGDRRAAFADPVGNKWYIAASKNH